MATNNTNTTSNNNTTPHTTPTTAAVTVVSADTALAGQDTPTTSGEVTAAPPSPQATFPSLINMFADSPATYSPSRPALVFNGNYNEFLNINLFTPVDVEHPSSSAISNNTVSIDSYELPGQPLTDKQLYTNDFFASDEFNDWYMEKLTKGALDSVTYDQRAIQDLQHRVSTSTLPVDAIDPALLFDKHQGNNGDDMSGGAAEEIIEFTAEQYQRALELLQEMADQEDAQVYHPALRDSEFVNVSAVSDIQGSPYCGNSNDYIRKPQPPIKLVIDNSDINDITALNHALNEDGESEVASTAGGSDDDEEEEGNVEPCDVERHFWTRNGDIKYWVHHKGERLYLTAEQIEDRFNGVKCALWTYWHRKRAGQISIVKLMEHFRRMGHQGFFREMLWHLLPARLQRILNRLRKEGKLDSFFF
ncbi:hypothetical protein QFC20_006046 [Naganishia adeliensis]|uniref:Uncharacterized protein n=1 Tax=Naganishia adeliensis TaxID=92952 RepID=A0ACC2VFZ3_9TREE|nr:hypothetical protein QFC20_006046 [Naganishia adeliensis]